MPGSDSDAADDGTPPPMGSWRRLISNPDHESLGSRLRDVMLRPMVVAETGPDARPAKVEPTTGERKAKPENKLKPLKPEPTKAAPEKKLEQPRPEPMKVSPPKAAPQNKPAGGKPEPSCGHPGERACPK